jgi:hypothetical protein
MTTEQVWADPDSAVERAKMHTRDSMSAGLHPTDLAQSWREIETWAREEAEVQEDRNNEYGVPER